MTRNKFLNIFLRKAFNYLKYILIQSDYNLRLNEGFSVILQ